MSLTVVRDLFGKELRLLTVSNIFIAISLVTMDSFGAEKIEFLTSVIFKRSFEDGFLTVDEEQLFFCERETQTVEKKERNKKE